jgi:hypothetical protein
VLVGAGAGAWLAVIADDGYLARANVLATVVALVVLAVGLGLSLPIAVPVAIGLLGAEYVAILGFEAETLDTRAPLVAGALLAVAELAYWSLELRLPVADEAGTSLRRLALIAVLVLGTLALGAVLLALVEAVAAGGPAIDLLGAAAAVGALALLALAARQTRRSDGESGPRSGPL